MFTRLAQNKFGILLGDETGFMSSITASALKEGEESGSIKISPMGPIIVSHDIPMEWSAVYLEQIELRALVYFNKENNTWYVKAEDTQEDDAECQAPIGHYQKSIPVRSSLFDIQALSNLNHDLGRLVRKLKASQQNIEDGEFLLIQADPSLKNEPTRKATLTQVLRIHAEYQELAVRTETLEAEISSNANKIERLRSEFRLYLVEKFKESSGPVSAWSIEESAMVGGLSEFSSAKLVINEMVKDASLLEEFRRLLGIDTAR